VFLTTVFSGLYIRVGDRFIMYPSYMVQNLEHLRFDFFSSSKNRCSELVFDLPLLSIFKVIRRHLALTMPPKYLT
jgi:hypothetical protein